MQEDFYICLSMRKKVLVNCIKMCGVLALINKKVARPRPRALTRACSSEGGMNGETRQNMPFNQFFREKD